MPAAFSSLSCARSLAMIVDLSITAALLHILPHLRSPGVMGDVLDDKERNRQAVKRRLGPGTYSNPGWVAISRSPLRAARGRQRGVMRLRRTRSSQLSFCYKLSYCRNESDGYFHCGAFKSRLYFGGGCFITLGLEVFEHTTDSSLIPSAGIFFGSHLFFLRLRRVARFVFGPSSFGYS